MMKNWPGVHGGREGHELLHGMVYIAYNIYIYTCLACDGNIIILRLL